MNTPIADFAARYAAEDALRLHMPGHKGRGPLGLEHLDITEIEGADVLYSADGIIAESESNATALFGSGHTFYATEGSTLAIQAMLALVKRRKPARAETRILAARNVHKAFVYGCALLDIAVDFLYQKDFTHLTVCKITANEVEKALADRTYDAVYLTSPDYLGNIADIAGIAAVCHRHHVPLLVDNAHGAYLRFLPEDRHPISLGATMCCDSAHKTLPVLTGGAYLHISKNAPAALVENARETLALFASTSPSYLTLQSLDLCNSILADGYAQSLHKCIKSTETVREILKNKGYATLGDEPLKLTVAAAQAGLAGTQAAAILQKAGVVCELADRDLMVLMLSPSLTEADFARLTEAIAVLPDARPTTVTPPCMAHPTRVLSLRDAILAPHETLPIDAAVGRICAAPTVSCPPAVPVVMSGERIDPQAIAVFDYYGISTVSVVK